MERTNPWELPADRTGWLAPDTYVRLVESDAARTLEVAALGTEAAVPTCPGWSVGDLVEHLAVVYEHKVASTALGEAPDPWPPAHLHGREPVGLLEEATAHLRDMFAAHGPSHPSATWWPPIQDVGFWMRRMALETAVHRVDAELAHGVLTPVDAELAADGVDEVLVMMLAGDDWAERHTGAPIDARVAVTCGGRAWMVDADARRVWVDRLDPGSGPFEADAEAAGEPDVVLRWLWGRAAADDDLLLAGDHDVLAALRARLAEATQ